MRDGRAIEAARTALDGHTVVLLMGKAGAAKSTLAGAILRQCAESGRGICWASALRLAVVRAESRLGEEPKEIEDANDADVTVVDDLGSEAMTAQSAIVDVIHARHDGQAPLVVTTGLDRAQLGARYGGGVTRRLFEGANVIDVAFRSFANMKNASRSSITGCKGSGTRRRCWTGCLSSPGLWRR